MDLGVSAALAIVSKRLDAVRPGAVSVLRKDAAKQIVMGVVLDPYVVDAHDDWVPPSQVEASAHKYLAGSRTVKLQHGDVTAAVVVESSLLPYPTQADYAAAMELKPHRIWRMKIGEDFVHSGAWLIGIRILDGALWEKVLSGEITGFSIGGFANRTEVEDLPMPEVTVLTVEAPQ